MKAGKLQRKIMIIGNSYHAVFGLRQELIERLVKDGYEVWAVFPNGPFGYGEETGKRLGCHFANISLARRGKNPLQEARLLLQLFGLLRKVHPDMTLAYTIKPTIYAGILCGLSHTAFMANITGLGEAALHSRFVRRLLKTALKNAACVFFQNEKDKRFFEQDGFRYQKHCLLSGSGVNLERYSGLKYPKGDTIRFTYVARVMKTKGIEEFLAAAAKMKAFHEGVEFHVCGICEEDYEELMERYQREGVICYHGFLHSITKYYETSHCVVMPSYYPEGMSNVLLEAAACARPVITTDQAGCREAVEDGVTGFLVKIRDGMDLYRKMERFYGLSWEEKERMGKRGRERMESMFDRKRVVDDYMKIIDGCFAEFSGNAT